MPHELQLLTRELTGFVNVKGKQAVEKLGCVTK
jgi:hypothetical protein